MALAELIAEEPPVPLVRVGLRDVFPRSGESEALLDHYHLGVNDIVQAAETVLKKKGQSQGSSGIQGSASGGLADT